MSRINTPPIGLQDLLGSKNFGDNPSDLLEQVRPVVDLLPFWGTQKLKFAAESATTAGAGSVVELDVPENENWAILSAHFQRTLLSAGEGTRMVIAWSNSAFGTTVWPLAATAIEDPKAGRAELDLIYQPANLWLLPAGSQLRGIINSSDIASTDYILSAIYYAVSV